MAVSNESIGSQTIVGLPIDESQHLTALCLEQAEEPDVRDLAVQRRMYKIRLADTDGRRSSASMLIHKMYSWRGYGTSVELTENPHRVTLVAADEKRTIGTLTLGFDSPLGLLVDQMYRPEVNQVRAQGRRICELTKLAVDKEAVNSKRVLAALFHIAYIYGRKINRMTDVFIEVNPRHVGFYERMLGFTQAGPERTCPRVNAPAVLLRLDLEYSDEQISLCGGTEAHPGDRSLYPYFFSKREEVGIARRIAEIN